MAKSHKTPKRSILDPSQYHPTEEVRAYIDSAEQFFADGDFAKALEIYRKILAVDKFFILALKRMALCELQVNAPQNAVKHLMKYTKSVATDPEAYAYLAQAHLISGQPAKAKQSITRAMKLAQTADLYFLAATIDEQLNEPAKAITHYERGLALSPAHSGANLALGIVHKNLGNFNQAIQLFETTLATKPEDTNALVNLGNVYHAIGLYEQASTYYREAQQLTQSADISFNLGLSLQQLAKPAESMIAFKHAIELEPAHLDARYQLAETLSELGDFNAAEKILDSIISDEPGYVHAWYAKSQYSRFSNKGSEVEKKLLALSKQKHAPENTSLVHFGLAKIYDDTQRHDEAFEHFSLANKHKAKILKRAAEQQLEELRNPTININQENLDFVVEDIDQLTPIFIIGMPRSGTTLLERNIAQANNVSACGEVDFFGPSLFRLANKLGDFSAKEEQNNISTSSLIRIKHSYLKRIEGLAGTSQYFIDKTPDNFRLVSTLESLFPSAKFIHCKRNPLDTCLSIFFQNFENVPYSYDLRTIAKYYLLYRNIVDKHRQRLVAKNRWLDVVYEDYVSDEKNVTAKISTFLDCEINISSNNNAVDKRPIRTMSKWQARQDTHQSAIGRWEFYKDKLADLQNALSSVL